MAVDTLINITQDEIEYVYMSSLLKGELDWHTGMAEAKREGLAGPYGGSGTRPCGESARNCQKDENSGTAVERNYGIYRPVGRKH